MLTCTLDCTSGGARSASRALWLYHQADRALFCWQVTAMSPALHEKVTAREGDLLYYQISLHLYSFDPSQRGGKWCYLVLLQGSNKSRKALSGRARWQSGPGTASESLPAHHGSSQTTVLIRSWLFFFFLTKAVSAETSFLPGIVYAVWETSLKYIGKRLP